MGIRERTFRIYQMFSHQTDEKIYETMKDLKVDYMILDTMWCGNPKPGCNMRDLFDTIYPELVGRPCFCEKWLGPPALSPAVPLVTIANERTECSQYLLFPTVITQG